MNGSDPKMENRKKIKILQVNKLYAPVNGGIERVAQQLAEGLRDRTDTKVLVCQQKGKGTTEWVNGVEVRRSSSIGTFFSMPVSFSFLWDFRRLSRDRDIVQLHLPFPMGDLACLLSGYRGRVVLWWHSDIVRQKKILRFYKPLMNWMLRRADVILVATQGHIDHSPYLRPFASKCVVIPFGVKKIGPVQPFQEHWPVRFLFIGRLVSYKGCDVLLQAFRQVEQAELTLIGDGVLREELEKKAREFHLEGRVRFLHGLSDQQVQEQLRQCDVLVLPSVTQAEAFGLVQIEAMAWGKPVINTFLPSGVPYVSLDQVTGRTVEAGNPEALAQAMREMVEHPERRKRWGENARKRVEENYLEESMLEQVYQVYKEEMESSTEHCRKGRQGSTDGKQKK